MAWGSQHPPATSVYLGSLVLVEQNTSGSHWVNRSLWSRMLPWVVAWPPIPSLTWLQELYIKLPWWPNLWGCKVVQCPRMFTQVRQKIPSLDLDDAMKVWDTCLWSLCISIGHQFERGTTKTSSLMIYFFKAKSGDKLHHIELTALKRLLDDWKVLKKKSRCESVHSPVVWGPECC